MTEGRIGAVSTCAEVSKDWLRCMHAVMLRAEELTVPVSSVASLKVGPASITVSALHNASAD
jgi:hypothetical protein